MRKLLKKIICMPFRKKLVPAANDNKKIEQWVEIDPSEFGNTPKNLTTQFPRTIYEPARIFPRKYVWFGPGSLVVPVLAYRRLFSWRQHRCPSFQPKLQSKNVIDDLATLMAGLSLTTHHWSDAILEWDGEMQKRISAAVRFSNKILDCQFDRHNVLVSWERALFLQDCGDFRAGMRL